MSLHLSIGAGGETGPLEKTAAGASLANLALFADFHNTGSEPLSALIDARPLANGEYLLEATTTEGEPVSLAGCGGCGTMAPLMDHEIFTIEPGRSARTRLSLGFYHLTVPGNYRVRVRYTAHESPHDGDATTSAKPRLSRLWKGSLDSDWVAVTIRPR